MSKKVLLVESDTAHARELYKALEACHVEVRVTGDGREGLELARDERPDAIVLCVELPRVSGYSICQKLKKDGALKDIPVVLISAEATLDTFEQHRKLKGRAEEYLIKPFPPQALVAKLAPILGIDPGAEQTYPSDEEMVTLADVELEATGSHPLGGAGANPLAGGDDDLKFLDDAFDRLSSGAEPREAEVEVGLDLSPGGDDDARLDAAFGGLDAAPEPAASADAPSLAWPEPSAAGGEAEDEPSRLSGELEASEADRARLASELEASEAARRELESRLARAEERTTASDAEAARLAGELEQLQGATPAARELEQRLATSEEQVAALTAQLSDLEAASARNQERLLRAVSRLQQDAAAREKLRKALAIAVQLLGPEAASAQQEDTPPVEESV